ncbi:hydrolase [Lacimicrobium sp. SS2-24]|uniref:hydrolase n=1 Tax=Lacimicrobium sp. SS2-24 TaxID=2005569 RepID=UPI000B4B0A4D|nr:hydrolase [Lacimicrobium sp. SS2-24]
MSKAGFGQVVESDFSPPWWALNRHVQTLWPRFVQRRAPVTLRWEQFDLPDGDFIELAWTPTLPAPKGLVVCFHGLEGSVRSHYANDLAAFLHRMGWQTVVMHFRGCGTRPNLTPRAYHSGDTEDAIYLLQELQNRYPHVRRYAVGFSLGANMLLKLLGENIRQRWVKGAVAISPPLKLSECAASIGRGFSRVYQRYLLNSMRNRLLVKMQQLDYSELLQVDARKVSEFSCFRDFDQYVTAPLHGFDDVDDYYTKCSAIHYLRHIATPTLVLHAADDPFMNHSVIPKNEELSTQVRVELSRKGGHVGFLQGTPWKPIIWTHQRVLSFLSGDRP